MLDKFFHMNDVDVSSEYNFSILKPMFKGGDYDKRLILILDSVNNKDRLFSDSELKIIATIIKCRNSKIYGMFSDFYPILKGIISETSSREENLSIIRQLLVISSSVTGNFGEDDVGFYNSSGSPGVKHARSFQCLSPSAENSSYSIGDESGLSTSYRPEVIFGFVNDSVDCASFEFSLLSFKQVGNGNKINV